MLSLVVDAGVAPLPYDRRRKIDYRVHIDFVVTTGIHILYTTCTNIILEIKCGCNFEQYVLSCFCVMIDNEYSFSPNRI